MRILKRVLIGLGVLTGLFVVGIAAAAYFADIPGLIEQYRPVLVKTVSEALDRPVRIDKVEATFFPTLGVRVRGFHIADVDASGAPAPDFVEVEQAQVGLAIWPALVSFGKDIHVTVISLRSPTIRVVRFPDGSFNFSSLGAKKKEGTQDSEPEPAPDAESTPSSIRPSVGRIEIVEGHFSFDDRTNQEKPIVLDAIGLRADNLGLGKPAKATLGLALGSEEPNIRFSVETKPLPSSLAEVASAELKQVELLIEDLGMGSLPIKVEGLYGARVIQVSLRVTPSSKGYRLEGKTALEQVAIATTPFDLRFNPVVETSTSFDQFGFDGTTMDFAGLSMSLRGEVSIAPSVQWSKVQLTTEKPFNLQSVGRFLPKDPPAIPGGAISMNLTSSGSPLSAVSKLGLRWKGFDYEAGGTKVSGEVVTDLSIQGRFQSPSVRLAMDASTLEVSGSGFKKAAGMRTDLEAAVDVEPTQAKLESLVVRLGDAALKASGNYPLGKTGRGEVKIKLEPVALAPLLGKLGLPTKSLPDGSRLAMNAAYKVELPKGASFQLKSLDYRAGRSQFVASADVSQFAPLRAVLRGKSPYLDIDALVPPTEGEAAEAPPPSKEPTKTELPPAVKEAIVRMELDVKRMKASGIEMNNMKVQLVLEDGVLRVQKTRLGVFGGQIVADGTKVNLASSPLQYDIKAGISRISGADLVSTFLGMQDSVSGRLDSKLSLSGAGFATEELAKSLDGDFSLSILNGKLSGVDLVGSTLGPLATALKSSAKSGPLETSFRKVAGSFSVENGKIVTTDPIQLNTSKGTMNFQGSVSVAGDLDMNGQYAVPASTLRSLTGGKIRPSSSTMLGFKLGCSVTKPCVRSVATDDVVKNLTKQAAGDLLNRVGGKFGGKGSKAAGVAGELIEDQAAVKKKAEAAAKKAADEAKAKAEAEAKALEAKAKSEAEAARKKAEEAAKKKAKSKLKGLFGR